MAQRFYNTRLLGWTRIHKWYYSWPGQSLHLPIRPGSFMGCFPDTPARQKAQLKSQAAAQFVSNLQPDGLFGQQARTQGQEQVRLRRFPNPKGIESSSPGLRGTSYPGFGTEKVLP
jgi:hypothetical protein